MKQFVLALLSALWLGACDSGVPPRNQADTLAEAPTSPSSAATVAAVTALETQSHATAPSTASADAIAPALPAPSTATVQSGPPALPNATPQPQPHPPVVPGAEPAPSAAAPFAPERACKQDSDCELVPDDCRHCPPCQGTWRRAVNHAALNRIVKEQRAIPCPPIMCPKCFPRPAPPGQPPVTTGYLGSAAKCEARQCVAK